MKQYYTTQPATDGFGAQYQRRIETYIYCKIHNLNFAYDKLNYVEHNYTNDDEFNSKLEIVMNLKNNIINVNNNMNCKNINYGEYVIKYFDENIDYCCDSEHMKFIKECYWQNKDRDFFKNNKLNIAIHIRRENSHDKGVAGQRATTPNSYYLNIMNKIREKYNNKDLSFHIYSQGNISSFNDLSNNDVKFYLNNDLVDTFKGLVAANVLVTSPSSLSYVAALISDGEIYYKKFWHNPKKDWIVCN